MLVIEDYIFGLEWAKEVGGLAGMIARSQANAAALNSIVSQLPWLDHLVADPAIRSNTSVCLKFADGVVEGMDEAGRLALVKKLAATLEAEDVAYDIAGHRDAPAGLRIWCGATVDADDVEKLGPWLDWAWHSIRS
jgi:phosphoserine aminotransferase